MMKLASPKETFIVRSGRETTNKSPTQTDYTNKYTSSAYPTRVFLTHRLYGCCQISGFELNNPEGFSSTLAIGPISRE